MKLAELRIEAFKSILRTTLVPDSFATVLVGGNDSGKSNVIEAVRLCLSKLSHDQTCHFSQEFNEGKPPALTARFSVEADQERKGAPDYQSLPDSVKEFDAFSI